MQDDLHEAQQSQQSLPLHSPPCLWLRGFPVQRRWHGRVVAACVMGHFSSRGGNSASLGWCETRAALYPLEHSRLQLEERALGNAKDTVTVEATPRVAHGGVELLIDCGDGD